MPRINTAFWTLKSGGDRPPTPKSGGDRSPRPPGNYAYGHIITSDLSDDTDIQREIKSRLCLLEQIFSYANLQNVQAQLK
jgi:hypothetical protein